MIVAIDGPAGSGKGTVTKILAERLGLINLDTGATYRCVALATLDNNYTLQDEEKITELLPTLDIEFKIEDGKEKVFLNGRDVTDKIRSKEVNQIVSQVSGITPVRIYMAELQRKMANGKDVIMEGRDIGTYVFPNAEVKIYLDADVEERAKRRYKENLEKGIDMSYEEVLENIKKRDENDKNKKIGALKVAEGAIIVDTTSKTIKEVADEIENIIKSHSKKD